MYSGVPKAGAPDFISTLEVNVPITHGAPGLIYWARATTHKASAIDCATAPAIVTGAIAPAKVNGVTIRAWFFFANRIQPSSIGSSCFSGDVELIFVNILGLASNSSWFKLPAIRTISITSSTRSFPKL